MTWIEGYFLSGVILAFGAPQIIKQFGRLSALALALYPLSGFVLALLTGDRLERTRSSHVWVEHLNINLTLGLDPLGHFFWLLITGIGTLIFIYAGGYLDKGLGRLLCWLTVFMVAMLGVVSAQDFITLFIAWEATSITSFMLIGFKFDSPDSRRSALQPLMVTGAGGLVLLSGLIVLGIENHSYHFADLNLASPLAILLIAVGCFTKSAQFPFHFWLPNAMAAPTPVSAYLHSATMVKAGVFLLAKFTGVFGPQPLIATIGAVTLVLGSLLSLGERDLKRILAWSTVAALGSMVMLAGIGTKAASEALVITILAHACYKGTLFMVAGNIDLITGTRDVFRLGKLGPHEKLLASAAALAGLSMAGIPVFLGFIKKEAQLEALQDPLFTAAVLIAGACSVVAAYNVAVRPFWLTPLNGEPTPERKLRSGKRLLTGPIKLALAGIAAGIIVKPIGDAYLARVASQVAGQDVPNHLAMFHGFNATFFMSMGAIATGLVVSLFWPRLLLAIESIRTKFSLSTESLAASAFRQSQKVGTAIGNLMTTASFRQQMLGYFITFIISFLWLFFLRPFAIDFKIEPLNDIPLNVVIVCIFAMVAAVAAILAKHRMGSVATLGVVGVAVTLTFISFSAPDLALTQLMIEVLSVVLFVLVFSHLPRMQSFSTPFNRMRDAAVAGGFGLVMAFLVLGVLSVPKPTHISEYYAETSYTKAKGRNVVNTILVDYRGLDTLGEITVLCVAALGAHTLIRFRPIRKRKEDKKA